MTWLDVGNGWRNIYLLSCMVQMGALGCLFAARGWFSKSRTACFLTGVSATPLVQYLWTLLLAAVWPNASRMVYIGALPAMGAVCALVMSVLRLRCLKEKLSQLLAYVKKLLRFDKPALAALCFALCLAMLIGPACVRFMSSMDSISGGDAGEYMALGQRFCEDRSLGNLLEKEETVGHFRGHSHFPSLELYMSYGLFHTDGEVGYPHDKAAFTGLGMLIFYAGAAYVALLLHFCREKKVCVLLGAVLFNLVPELYWSVAGAPRDIWRILALLWAALAFAGLKESGSWKQYLGKLLWVFALCFTVMSTHVVCFVVLPFIVIAWVLWRFLHAGLTSYAGVWRALLRSVGLAFAGAIGTVAAFAGNIWCFVKWGEMSPWRLMTTFTDAPWYDMYMDIEYKLDETTTHLNFFEAKDSILMGYATPIGTWGWRLALIAMAAVIVCLIVKRVAMRRQAQEIRRNADGAVAVCLFDHGFGAKLASETGLCAMLCLLTLAPMTGILDSPLYSFSGSFLKLPRYTLQWFMLCNVMICAALSALIDLWPGVIRRVKGLAQKPWASTIPAWLCAALCLLAMVKGTNQTGYTNTFYRNSRSVMESQSILLDNSFRARYGLLMDVAEHVEDDQKILITRVGYQYPLRGRGYLLTSNPIVPLMNLPLEEVGAAISELNVAMLATEPDFWDNRYYPLSTLHEWLMQLPPEQIVETEEMRLYLIDPALVPYAQP